MAKNRKVADPFSDESAQGPQVDEIQFNKIMGYIEKGKKEGAKLMCGGSRVGTEGCNLSSFVSENSAANIFLRSIFHSPNRF